MTHAKDGFVDLLLMSRRLRTCFVLAWNDFTTAHSRTILGLAWHPLFISIWLTGLVIIFEPHLDGGMENYIGYVAIGVLLWSFASVAITKGAACFIKYQNLILNLNVPLSMHVMRDLIGVILRLFAQATVLVVVVAFLDVQASPVMLLAIPGLLVGIVASFALMMILAVIGVIVRDLHFALGAVMRFLFFASPVFWAPTGEGLRLYIAILNPLTHFMEIVRAPLLGLPPNPDSWLVVGVITVTITPLAAWLFATKKNSIPFWL